ncbi:MAG: hypothetical protein NXI32_12930 [bacterium]|nr:hypothetical protein [bacterium]
MNRWRPQSPDQAVLWELWRTGSSDLLLRMSITLGFCLVIYGIERSTDLGPESVVISGILILVLTISASATQSWMSRLAFSDTGFMLRWQLLQPISTVRLVGLTLAYTLLTAFLAFTVPALLFSWLTGISVPLAGPLAILGCLVVCLLASTWAPKSMSLRILSLMTVIVILSTIAIIASRRSAEPVLMFIGRPETFYFKWYGYLALAVVAIIAFSITCMAVTRQRCGESLLGQLWAAWPPSEWKKSVQSARLAGSRRQGGFAGPVRAQFWYECQNFGKRILVLCCFFPIAVCCFIAVALSLGYDPGGGDRVWMIALLVAPIVYQIVGIDGAVGLRSYRGSLRMSTFDASRPLTSVQLIEIKLLVIAVCSILGWLLLAFCAGTYVMLLGDPNLWLTAGRQFLKALYESPLWMAIGLPLALTLVLTSTSAWLLAVWLWLPRHPWLSNAFTLAAVLHLFLFVWDSTHHFQLLFLWRLYAYLLPLCGLAVSAWILWRAYRQGICRTRLFAIACLLSGALLVCAAVIVQQVELVRLKLSMPEIFLMLVALLLTPMVSIAAAPLAFNLHRHQ